MLFKRKTKEPKWVAELKTKKLRCPECGYHVFYPTMQDGAVPGDPVVWCSDMGHWAGRVSDCVIAGPGGEE